VVIELKKPKAILKTLKTRLFLQSYGTMEMQEEMVE